MNSFGFVFFAVILFLVDAIIIVRRFTSYSKAKSGHERHSCVFTKAQRIAVFLLTAGAYVFLMLFGVMSELAAGVTALQALKTGILICGANTIRFPFIVVIAMLVYLLFEDRKLRGQQDKET